MKLFAAICLNLLFFLQLAQAQKPKLVVPIGHTVIGLFSCLFAQWPTVLSGSDDNTIKLWENQYR